MPPIVWLLFISAVAGCTRSEDRYVGTWHDDTQFVRLEANGVGEGFVFRKRGKRACTWVNRGDRIIITFGESPRSDVVEAKIERDGSLRVWSSKQSTTLQNGPLPFDEPAEMEEVPPSSMNSAGDGIGT